MSWERSDYPLVELFRRYRRRRQLTSQLDALGMETTGRMLRGPILTRKGVTQARVLGQARRLPKGQG